MSISQTLQPAVVNYSRQRHAVEVRDVSRPVIGPTDVLLEVAAVGVCGSDLHQWTADHSWAVNYPVILGHEFAGVIAEIGSALTGWKRGDRAVSETAAVIDLENPMSRQENTDMVGASSNAESPPYLRGIAPD